ncbi:MAG TPA: M1 family peptidase, partial [Ferruginibacter sp.]|nr:M1 family peptidase [Ferruginibacter sp.]
FDQYLRSINVPELEYQLKNKVLSYRYKNCVPGFNMPVKIKNSKTWLNPTEQWQTRKYKHADFAIDDNFYIKTISAIN